MPKKDHETSRTDTSVPQTMKTDTLVPPSSPLKNLKEVSPRNSYQLLDATDIKRIFDESSTHPHQEEASASRSPIDVVLKRRLTGDDSFSCPNPHWDQVGVDIDGERKGDREGCAVALSANGLIMAIGARFHDGVNGDFSGLVRVYRRNYDASLGWFQIGQGLYGDAPNDNFGSSVALSDDGEVLAVGAYLNDDGGTNSGHVRVFQRDTPTSIGWSQIGQDIDGEAPCDLSATANSITLSGGGDVLAIGASNNDDHGSNSGHVRVYERDPSSPLGWQQAGGDLDGEAAFDYFGNSVALSNNGDIVAIGGYGNDGYGYSSGHVRVYRRSLLTHIGWIQVGEDIGGEESSDWSGYSVSLSDDGAVLAIGAPYNSGNGACSGHVRVYGRDTSSTIGWSQVGSDINGEASGDLSGWAVSLSGNGHAVAISAILNDTNGDKSGQVRVYRREQVATIVYWLQVGNDLYGEASEEYGRSIALSSSGEVLAIGSPIHDEKRGRVQVFQACYQDIPPIDCNDTEDTFKLLLTTDDYGENTSWALLKKSGNRFSLYDGPNGAAAGNDYDDNTSFTEERCLPKDECYKFLIHDSSGDGLCCSNGYGGYNVYLNDILIRISSFTDERLELTDIGSC